MALNFPSNPPLGHIYSDTGSGFAYEWDGNVWKSYTEASASNIAIIDDISSSFDGILTSFTLTSNSGVVIPSSKQSLIINLGGVIQDPTDDYIVSSNNIIFTTPPASGLSFSGILLGSSYSVPTTDTSFLVSGRTSNTIVLVTSGSFIVEGRSGDVNVTT